jgi:uncharacterized protein (TIGR02145 family)
MSYEQSGIEKIVLYENIDLTIVWANNTTIDSIITTGQTITLTDCEFLNYEDEAVIGANNKTLHDYTLFFRYFDLTLETIADIETLINTYGWVPALFFRNGEKKVINTPFQLQQIDDLETNVSHNWNQELKPDEPTEQELIPFNDTTLYKVTFNVDDGTDPINGAKVEINPTKFTDANGQAVFYLAAATYNYTITYSPYQTINDSFTLSADTVINETMEIVSNVKYGRLYNGYTAELSGLLPAGWEVAEKSDYDTLATFLGGAAGAAAKMKDDTLDFWNSPNTGATNESGFTAKGCGYRFESTGAFFDLKDRVYYWTKTIDGSNLYQKEIDVNDNQLYEVSANKKRGATIRGIYKGAGTPAEYIEDQDGSIYNVIQIGSQYWTQQPWASTKKNDGTALTEVTDAGVWSGLTTEGYCSYDNDNNNVFV